MHVLHLSCKFLLHRHKGREASVCFCYFSFFRYFLPLCFCSSSILSTKCKLIVLSAFCTVYKQVSVFFLHLKYDMQSLVDTIHSYDSIHTYHASANCKLTPFYVAKFSRFFTVWLCHRAIDSIYQYNFNLKFEFKNNDYPYPCTHQAINQIYISFHGIPTIPTMALTISLPLLSQSTHFTQCLCFRMNHLDFNGKFDRFVEF